MDPSESVGDDEARHSLRSRILAHVSDWWGLSKKKVAAMLGTLILLPVLTGIGVAYMVEYLNRSTDFGPISVRASASAAPTPAPSPAQGCWDHVEEGGWGWGPERAMFQNGTEPPHITLNSVVDNPTYGDERNFVMVKDAQQASAGGWQDRIEVQRGHEYLVRVYVHAISTDPQAHARNTRLSAVVPTCIGRSISLWAFLESSTTYPREIWDGANFWSMEEFNIAYVHGSGILYYNASGPQGWILDDASRIPSGSGVELGSTALDGALRVGYDGSAYLVFRVIPQFAS